MIHLKPFIRHILPFTLALMLLLSCVPAQADDLSRLLVQPVQVVVNV